MTRKVLFLTMKELQNQEECHLQCVTATKKLTYKKLQADFLKTLPKYKKIIKLK